MTRKTKGRNRWHGATPKAFCADNHSIRTRIDAAIVRLAVWGVLPVKLADWLINRGGPGHA